MTVRVTCWLGWLFLKLHRRFPDGRRVITKAGLGTVLGTLFGWVCLFWLGWALVFNSDRSALVFTANNQPADFWARVYFTGTLLEERHRRVRGVQLDRAVLKHHLDGARSQRC